MIAAMSRTWPLFLLAPATALGLAACGMPANLPLGSTSSSGAPSAPSAVVHLLYDSIEPGRVTITAGQTVEWKWQEISAANITFAQFHSPTMDSGSGSHTFSVPGTYPYRDTLSLVTGVIVVQS
jgi:plastocyanin